MDVHAHLTRQITEKNLAGHIHHFARRLTQLSEHRWANDGYPELRSGHVQLLRNLDPTGTRATVLAQRAHVTKQTMGRLIKELVRTGYLTLTPDATDNRAQLVQLTQRGNAFIAYLATTLVDLEYAFSQVLGKSRLGAFQAALYDLTAFVETRHQQLR